MYHDGDMEVGGTCGVSWEMNFSHQAKQHTPLPLESVFQYWVLLILINMQESQ